MRPLGPTASLVNGGSARLARIDKELELAYGTPESELGSQSGPLDECVCIILSFQTDVARLKASWESLRKTFPSWYEVRRARVRSIAASIRSSRLQTQKAERIKALLSKVEELTSSPSQDSLRVLNDADAESFLLKLPGLSWKGAWCVLLYSLGHERFPVDGNAFRILRRTGVLSAKSVYRRRELHNTLELSVPAARRRALHVNLVIHGQRICLSVTPTCQARSLRRFCPRIGLDSRFELEPGTGRPQRSAPRGGK